MVAAAKRLEDAAELLVKYAKEDFAGALNAPGVDPVSSQATRVLREQLNSERMVAARLAANFQQHAADIRKTVGDKPADRFRTRFLLSG